MKICIIGGVAAGASAAARLRRLNEEAEIILFERGEHVSFANCGLPYHISGTIPDRDRLILMEPQDLRDRFAIDVRVKNEVLSIDRKAKKIGVRGEKEYEETYDKLIFAPGAAPFVPKIEGANPDVFLNLRNIPDMDRMIQKLRAIQGKTPEILVVGGGFIGLEVAENLKELGAEVDLVEFSNQVMGPLDPELANILHSKLIDKGINLHFGVSVQQIIPGKPAQVVLSNGKKLGADFVVGAIGVRPESQLALAAGLEVGTTGGVLVNDRMQTSDPDIYAAGDVVEVRHHIGGKAVLIPLAGPANRQGRVVADQICGIDSRYTTTQGTGILKLFDLQAASTGINEKLAKKWGLKYQAIHLHPANHAGYYPGSVQMALKVLFDPETGKILGAQGVGPDGVDKRVDVLATAIRAGLSVRELEDLELNYAPPFGSAKDPVNMAGFVGTNIMQGLVRIVTLEQVEQLENPWLLDVRTPDEFARGSIPGATNIPLDSLRGRLHEIPKDRNVLIFCQVGIRSYNAYRILKQKGFERIFSLSGGYKTYLHSLPVKGEEELPSCCAKKTPFRLEQAFCSSPILADRAQERMDCLDLRGLQCPGPILKLKKKLSELSTGDRLQLVASDPGFVKDLPAFCSATGNVLVSAETKGRDIHATVQKGNGLEVKGEANHMANSKDATLVVFSNDLDKALAAFIIANGARAMGGEVTLFFTFWGLNILRKDRAVPVQKGLLDRMFGFMMPRGSTRLALSKMHMLGMGTAMMKKVMKDKNVDSLPSLMETAKQAGVRVVACSMSMDVMGIKHEELIDGVEVSGVTEYLHQASQSGVNLFI